MGSPEPTARRLSFQSPELKAKRLSFESTASSEHSNVSYLERKSLLSDSPPDEKCDQFQLLDESGAGLGRVVQEAWDQLPLQAKLNAQNLVKSWYPPARPMRVTTLCSGTDGVIDAMKDTHGHVSFVACSL